MNEEIYVQYIDRIFESSLNIETSLSLSREKNLKDQDAKTKTPRPIHQDQ